MTRLESLLKLRDEIGLRAMNASPRSKHRELLLQQYRQIDAMVLDERVKEITAVAYAFHWS